MELLINCEIVAAIVLPFLLGILRKRGAITEKQASFTIATNVGLIIGTFYLSLGKPETIFSVPFADWLVAIALSLFCWVFSYLFLLWVFRQLYHE
jgi:hypothetical protein